MSGLRLLHLTFVGPGKEPASVEFDQHLTVIYGASDTGKSFIVEAIDYMLGAGSLKKIPEADGYTRVLLGLRRPDGEVVTLSRPPEGTKVALYLGDVRTLTTAAPSQMLSFKHNAKSQGNLSRYLLDLVGADNRYLLKNQRRDRVSLSFRQLVHLCVISETRMAAPRSPVLTSGQNTNVTAEKSAFRYLLTGQDEPEGEAAAGDTEKKVGKGKIELLDQLISTTRAGLVLQSSEAELRTRLGLIEDALAQASASVEDLVFERSTLVELMRAQESRISDNRARAGEIRTLLARFQLLRQQYESDLERLEMVSEAGALLGYFRLGVCVFCGAEPEHQRADHLVHESTRLQSAVTAEARKTTELDEDLGTTIDDLQNQLNSLDDGHATLQHDMRGMAAQLSNVEERLRPLHADTAEMLATRTQIHTDLTVHGQVQRLEDLRADLSVEPVARPPAHSDTVSASTLADFERLVQRMLSSWQVPGNNLVTYHQNTAEITVDGRDRHSRGKGMRSIIHAAFTTALALYTTTRELPHPGFVVLDSPVLTYREPHEQDVQLTHNVVDHFYHGLLDDLPVQTIVVENGDPPSDLATRAKVYAFSTEGSDRAGFFPVAEAETPAP